MRSDQEIFDLILSFARNDDNIRALVMNGSRANPQAKKDPFQDFDIACLVTDMGPYWQNKEIPLRFGEIMILQTPDDMHGSPPDDGRHYTFLTQYVDGVRIDLSFHTLDRLEEVLSDTPYVVLLDKDGRIAEPSSAATGYPAPPTGLLFFDCCNEFWWVTPYVAKGLWRAQLTYARYHLDVVLREQLMTMLAWYFGVQTGFQKSPGKMGKYLKEYLDPALWALLESTYAGAQPEQSWDALLAMGELFRQAGRCVAEQFHFTYPEQEDERVTAFIRRIRDLPQDAETL